MGRLITWTKMADSTESDSSLLAAFLFLMLLACLACLHLSAASNRPSAFLLPALHASALASLQKERLENAFAGLALLLASSRAHLAFAFNVQHLSVLWEALRRHSLQKKRYLSQHRHFFF